MSHIDNSALRRYVDEPDVLLSYEKVHLLNCGRCRSALEVFRNNAETAQNVLHDRDVPVDLGAARDAVYSRAVQASSGPAIVPSIQRRHRWEWSAVAAACLLVAALFSYAPFRAYAQNLLTIFEPRQFTPVSVTQSDIAQLRGVPELRDFGTVTESGTHRVVEVPSFSAAQSYAGGNLVRPAYLPASVPRTAKYQISTAHAVSFTFDEKKARATAARKHVTLPTVPPNINGSTLSVDVGAVIMQVYGAHPLHRPHGKVHRLADFPHDTVVIAQAPVPSVRTTSASASEIESYLLSLPNVPEDVKAQIRAIRDPSSTLPVPIPVSKETARSVEIQGAPGLLVGDNTGVGSVIVWQKNNRIYSVAGGYTADEMMKVANSMKP